MLDLTPIQILEIKHRKKKKEKNLEMIPANYVLERLIPIQRQSLPVLIPKTWMKMNLKCFLKQELGWLTLR